MRTICCLVLMCLVGTVTLYDVAFAPALFRPAGEPVLRPVASAVFKSIGYREADGRLTVAFRRGCTYEYCGVPRACFEGFTHSVRKGEFFNSRIRSQFPCRRISDARN